MHEDLITKLHTTAKKQKEEQLERFRARLEDTMKSDPEVFRILGLIIGSPASMIHELWQYIFDYTDNDILVFSNNVLDHMGYVFRGDTYLCVRKEVPIVYNAACRKMLIAKGGKQDRDSSSIIYDLLPEDTENLHFDYKEHIFTYEPGDKRVKASSTEHFSLTYRQDKHSFLSAKHLYEWLAAKKDRYLKEDVVGHWLQCNKRYPGKEKSRKELEDSIERKTYPFYYADMLNERHFNAFSEELLKKTGLKLKEKNK